MAPDSSSSPSSSSSPPSPSPSAIGSAIDKMYTGYVLRDFAGKVLPGAIVGAAWFYGLFGEHTEAKLESAIGLGVPFWLLSLAACWMLGYTVQSLGEATPFLVYGLEMPESNIPERIRFWPRRMTRLPLKSMYERQVAVLARNDIANSNYMERMAAVREMCGNGAVALGVSAIALLVQSEWPLAVVLIVVALLLARMHRVHAFYYWLYGSAILKQQDTSGTA